MIIVGGGKVYVQWLRLNNDIEFLITVFYFNNYEEDLLFDGPLAGLSSEWYYLCVM